MTNESIISKATNFVWAMFRLNLFVAASNVILIVLVLTIPFHLVTIPLYIVGAYFLVMSLIAMFAVLKRLEDAEKISLWRLYCRCYGEEFKGSIWFALWYILGALVLYSAYLGLPFVPEEIRFLPLYTLIGVLLYVHFVFAMLVKVNYITNLKGIWRIGLYCISRHPMYALFIFGGTLIAGALMNVFPILIVLGMVPGMGYLLTVATRKLFSDLAVKLKENEPQVTPDDSNKADIDNDVESSNK